MKAITYFRAYVQCKYRLSNLEAGHKTGLFGIAVSNSPMARSWRRYTELAHKLERRLEALLSED